MGISRVVEPNVAHPVERELARIFDELEIRWEYEPTTFVLERNADGSVAEAFTLPEQEMYVECTTMRLEADRKEEPQAAEAP